MRNRNGSLSRPGMTNQHSPVPSLSTIDTNASTTSATSRMGNCISSSIGRASAMMAVSANDGHSALIRMPVAAYSRPRDRTSPTTACLLATYTGSKAGATMPAMLAVATICPPPRAASAGRAAWTPKTTPSRFTPMARR